MYIGSPQSQSRSQSPAQSGPPVSSLAAQSHPGRAKKKKKLLPKMDSDKTTGNGGLSGSSQCPAPLIRGLRSCVVPPHPVAPRLATRRSRLQEKAARPARLGRLDAARRVGAARPFACPFFHPGPVQASPVQPFPFVGHLRSARWAPACPITIRCLGLAPQPEQIGCCADSVPTKLLPAPTPPAQRPLPLLLPLPQTLASP